MFRKRIVGTAAGAAALMATSVLAGCGSTSAGSTGSGSSAAAIGGTFTLAVSAPFTMDPVTTTPEVPSQPVYDTLIHSLADGSYQPDLATSWKFLDSGHTKFQFTLRTDAVFSDGAKMTADAVVASLKRATSTAGATSAGPISSITATASNKVLITYSEPQTETSVLYNFSEQANFGQIVGPQALANPKSLATTSDGVGPYVLSSISSTGATFVKNPKYFNQDAIKFDKVVMQVMSDQSARLNALLTGQVDYAYDLGTSNLDQVKNAGKGASVHGSFISSLLLENRSEGSPLANDEVRQAIAYAIDRQSVINVAYGGEGTVTSSITPEGFAGYAKEDVDKYSYDVDKAKQLLADAGYADGFTITVADYAFLDPGNVLAEALADQLKDIGITLDVKTVPASVSFSDFFGGLMGKKYDAYVTVIPGSDVNTIYTSFLGPGTTGDPWNFTDTELTSLLSASTTQPNLEAEDAALQKATKRLDDLLWVVPVGVTKTFDGLGAKIAGAPATGPLSIPILFDPTGAESIYRTE